MNNIIIIISLITGIFYFLTFLNGLFYAISSYFKNDKFLIASDKIGDTFFLISIFGTIAVILLKIVDFFFYLIIYRIFG